MQARDFTLESGSKSTDQITSYNVLSRHSKLQSCDPCPFRKNLQSLISNPPLQGNQLPIGSLMDIDSDAFFLGNSIKLDPLATPTSEVLRAFLIVTPRTEPNGRSRLAQRIRLQ